MGAESYLGAEETATSLSNGLKSELGQPIAWERSVEVAAASSWCLSRCKRLFDFSLALLMLVVLSVPALLIAEIIRLSSKGGALFVQDRVGRWGRCFHIYKFRTMSTSANGNGGPGLTRDGDSRITGVGKYLRKFKLDEIPQLYNVLRGDMSLVGPRPKSPEYSEPWNMPFRPGITGLATLAFRREEELLKTFADLTEMEVFYQTRIKPLKVRLDAHYMRKCTFWSDIRVLVDTVLLKFA